MRCPRKIKKWVKDGRKEKNCTGQRFVNGSWRTCIEVVVVDGKEEKRDAHIYRQKRFSLVFLFLASNYRSPSSKRWDDGGASDVNPIQRLSPFPILPDCWLWRPQQSFFLSEPRSEGNDGPNPPGVYIYISIYPYCSVIFVMCAHNKKSAGAQKDNGARVSRLYWYRPTRRNQNQTSTFYWWCRVCTAKDHSHLEKLENIIIYNLIARQTDSAELVHRSSLATRHHWDTLVYMEKDAHGASVQHH